MLLNIPDYRRDSVVKYVLVLAARYTTLHNNTCVVHRAHNLNRQVSPMVYPVAGTYRLTPVDTANLATLAEKVKKINSETNDALAIARYELLVLHQRALQRADRTKHGGVRIPARIASGIEQLRDTGPFWNMTLVDYMEKLLHGDLYLGYYSFEDLAPKGSVNFIPVDTGSRQYIVIQTSK